MVSFLGASRCLHVGCLRVWVVFVVLCLLSSAIFVTLMSMLWWLVGLFLLWEVRMFWCFRWCFNWWLFEYLIGAGFSLCTEFCLLGFGACPS